MGANQDKAVEYWISIEECRGQLFDFNKVRSKLTPQPISYPSYLNFYPKTSQLQYTMMHDKRHMIVCFDSPSNFSNDLLLSRNMNRQTQTVWKVLAQKQQYQLEEGDRIKLGAVELYLKQLKHITTKKSLRYGKEWSEDQTVGRLGAVQPLKNSGYFTRLSHRMRESDLISMKMSAMYQSGVSQKSSNERGCRICFESKSTSSNPLFNVCLCSGSVKYLHLQCLRQWFRSKTVRMESPHCVYYSYEPMQCQLCHYSISNRVEYAGRTYSLYDYEHMHPPYAQMEHCTDSKIYQILIRLEENLQIDVGRGPHNDLNLNDPSLSRTHCTMTYKSHRLLLEPMQTRHGTAVDLSRNLVLNDSPIQLLIGQQLIQLGKTENQECCGGYSHPQIIVE